MEQINLEDAWLIPADYISFRLFFQLITHLRWICTSPFICWRSILCACRHVHG